MCGDHELAAAPRIKAGYGKHGSMQKAWEYAELEVCGTGRY